MINSEFLSTLTPEARRRLLYTIGSGAITVGELHDERIAAHMPKIYAGFSPIQVNGVSYFGNETISSELFDLIARVSAALHGRKQMTPVQVVGSGVPLADSED